MVTTEESWWEKVLTGQRANSVSVYLIGLVLDTSNAPLLW